MNIPRLKRWQKIGLAGVLGFALLQVVSCTRDNPPVNADIRVSQDVKAVLQRACYDCHSNETTWPWYSRVAPMSWLVHRDVTEGRAELNFSDWESMPPAKRAKKQVKIGKEVAKGEMPLWFYTPLHPHAVLTDADKLLLQTWALSTSEPNAKAD
jgi:hypothetical protein